MWTNSDGQTHERTKQKWIKIQKQKLKITHKVVAAAVAVAAATLVAVAGEKAVVTLMTSVTNLAYAYDVTFSASVTAK